MTKFKLNKLVKFSIDYFEQHVSFIQGNYKKGFCLLSNKAFINMIQKDKNLEAKQNIEKIIIRAQQIKDKIRLMFDYLLFSQQKYHSYSKNVFQNLITFETKIAKNCRYEPQKTNMILRLSRQYRQLPGKIQSYSQVNLNKIPNIIRHQQLNKHELQLKKKTETFYNQFRNYSSTINEYNTIYQKYLNNCNSLDEIIMKFKSYSDPLKFYDKSLTTQYQDKLQSQLNLSKNQQTKVTTQLQLLDSKRKFLDQSIKDIRESFTHLFQSSLKSIESAVTLVSDPAKDTGTTIERNFQTQMPIIDANESSKHSEAYQIQFQRLNTFTSIIDEGNEIMSDFNDIFKDKKSKRFNQQIVADHKLFSLRCENLKKKKQKAFIECLILHQSLFELFEAQIKNYKQFEKNFRDKQKKIFGINGKQTYKKDMQSFFGPNAFKLHQFMFKIIELPRKTFQNINVWINDNYVIFKEVIESKRQEIQKFNKLYDEIMNEHLKQKARFQQSDPNDTQVSQGYRANLVSSLDQFRFIFSQLEARQQQKDKTVTQKLTFLYKFIMKQYNACMIQNIAESNRDKLQMLKNFKIISQAMLVFKNDLLYNILYEEFFCANLEKSFQSKINQKQYDQAEAILKQKSKIAKKMLKRQIGCCGFVKASPIQSQVFSTHDCYIFNGEKKSPKGKLKILKQGLIFQESKWNPFAQKVHILIPKSDVLSIEIKTLSNNQSVQQMNEGVSLNTQKGSLILLSKQFDELYSALQKIYGETYRNSMALQKKGLTRNDSTQSGGFGRGSLLVSYNKQQKTFVEQPVCMNPALSRMSSSVQMQKKLKGSNLNPSAISINSDELRVTRSGVRSKEQIKEDIIIRSMYNKLIQHYDRHQFLPEKFIFVNKTYRQEGRKDYQYDDRQTHNHFLLKELKKHQIIDSRNGVILQINYQWKVSYPTSSSLHSFKHGEKIIVNLNSSPPSITIIQSPHINSQIYNRYFFYESIKQMNSSIWKYIVQNTNQDFLYEPTIEKENDPTDNSQDILIEDIKESGQIYPQELQIRQSKIYRGSNEIRPTSGEFIDIKGSNVRSMVSPKSQIRQSYNGETGQNLIRGIEL